MVVSGDAAAALAPGPFAVLPLLVVLWGLPWALGVLPSLAVEVGMDSGGAGVDAAAGGGLGGGGSTCGMLSMALGASRVEGVAAGGLVWAGGVVAPVAPGPAGAGGTAGLVAVGSAAPFWGRLG